MPGTGANPPRPANEHMLVAIVFGVEDEPVGEGSGCTPDGVEESAVSRRRYRLGVDQEGVHLDTCRGISSAWAPANSEPISTAAEGIWMPRIPSDLRRYSAIPSRQRLEETA